MTLKPMPGYTDAIGFILDHEGRIDEDVASDPGGKTHWGITLADYVAYRMEHGLSTKVNVFNMTPAEVAAVYKEHYADAVHFDALPYSVGLTLMDSAVNCGTGRVVCWLQAILGVTVDGGFGPKTLAATKNYITAHGALALAYAIIGRRSAYYYSIGAPGKTLNKFLKGWLNRLSDLKENL